MNSLRRSALIWITALLSAVGILVFFTAYELARRDVAEFLDGQLHQIALNAGEGFGDIAPHSAPRDADEDIVVSIWSASGESLRNSKHGAALPRADSQGFATIHAAGEDWRIYMASDGKRFVQVAQRMSVRDEIAQAAAVQAGTPILVAIPMAWLVLGWSLGQVLQRMSHLAQAIAARGVDAKEQISLVGAPLEVHPLIEAMNELITRLHRALEAQKRFVADAAHELRTPLAVLRIQLDNLRAQASQAQLPLVADLNSGVVRATTMVEQLLRLARSENASSVGPMCDVDLGEILKRCVADFVPQAGDKGIDMGLQIDGPLIAKGVEADLKILFGNVIDNAILYTPYGGSVDVFLRISPQPGIEILDTGCGVAEVEIPRLFDRFHRAAEPGIDGNGLGLAIAHVIARRHGMSITIENRQDRSGLRVRVGCPGAASLSAN